MLPEELECELERLYLKHNVRYLSEKMKFWEEQNIGPVSFCGDWTDEQKLASFELDYLECNFPRYFDGAFC